MRCAAFVGQVGGRPGRVRRAIWLVLAVASLVTCSSTAVERSFERESHIVLKVGLTSEAFRRVKSVGDELGAKPVGGSDSNVAAVPAEITLDVPSERYREFSKRLSEIGEVRSERLIQKNVTQQIESAIEAARVARARQARFERMRSTARGTQEALDLEGEIERASAEVALAEQRERDLRRGTSSTRVRVVFEREAFEQIVDPQAPFPWLDEISLERLQSEGLEPQKSHVLRAFFDASAGIRTGYAPDADAFDGNHLTVAFDMPIRVLGEANPVGLFGGLDFTLGGGGGIVYQVQFLGGAGIPIGSGLALGLASGPGIDGISGGTIPVGFDVPIELYLSIENISFMGLAAFLRDGWVFGPDERKHGSTSAPFGDELSTGIRFALGGRDDNDFTRERLGWRVGFDYRELMGTRVYQVVLGFGGHDADYSF